MEKNEVSKTVAKELDGFNAKMKSHMKSEIKEATKACNDHPSELPQDYIYFVMSGEFSAI